VRTLSVLGPDLRALLRDARFWLVAAGATGLALIVLGTPAGIISNPIFTRTVPTRPEDVVVWVLSAPLIGLTLASYVVRPHLAGHADRGQLQLGVGGLAVFFAIACPVCNKLVLLALGFSGALTVFAPIQPLIGVASLVLLGATLAYRARAISRTCERCVLPAESTRG
jgi:hypothetical protein